MIGKRIAGIKRVGYAEKWLECRLVGCNDGVVEGLLVDIFPFCPGGGLDSDRQTWGAFSIRGCLRAGWAAARAVKKRVGDIFVSWGSWMGGGVVGYWAGCAVALQTDLGIDGMTISIIGRGGDWEVAHQGGGMNVWAK